MAEHRPDPPPQSSGQEAAPQSGAPATDSTDARQKRPTGWIAACVVLALVADQLLALAGRLASPWTRARSAT